MAPETVHEAAVLDEDFVRYERVKKKGNAFYRYFTLDVLLILIICLGYVRLVTNLGPLNLELHCDMVPKTCENFIKLSRKGYYNGTKFHRSIKHFMVRIFNHTALVLRLKSNASAERFKEAIRQEQAQAENPIGVQHLPTNSSPIYLIPGEVFSQWPTLGPIRTNHNCKFHSCPCSLVLIIMFLPIALSHTDPVNTLMASILYLDMLSVELKRLTPWSE